MTVWTSQRARWIGTEFSRYSFCPALPIKRSDKKDTHFLTRLSSLDVKLQGTRLSLVPRLPLFYLLFAFTIMHGSRRLGRHGSVYHMSWCRGGACWNMYVLNLKASFLPVETSTCSLNHTKVVSPKLQHSTWMDNPVCCFGSWAPPLPYVHLCTWRHSMLPGLPHFNFSPVSHSHVLLRTQMKGKQTRPGNEAIWDC